MLTPPSRSIKLMEDQIKVVKYEITVVWLESFGEDIFILINGGYE